MIAWIRPFLSFHTLWAIIVAGLVLTNCTTGLQRDNARMDLATLKQQTAEAVAAQVVEANRDTIIKFNNAERITDEQAKRDQLIQLALDRSVSEYERMRDTVRRLNARPAPSDTEAARFAREASAARSALGECSGKYQTMDGHAKRLGSQVIGLQAFYEQVCRSGQEGAADPAQVTGGAPP